MKKHHKTESNFETALKASLLFNIVAAALILFIIAMYVEATNKADTYMRKSAELEVLTESLAYGNSQLNNRIEELEEALSTYAGDIVVNADAPPRYLDIPLDEDLQDYIWALCCDYNIADKYELVYAVIRKESNFNPGSISSTNDYGLMQINKSNHSWLSKRLGVTDFLDPTKTCTVASTCSPHCSTIMILLTPLWSTIWALVTPSRYGSKVSTAPTTLRSC